MTDRTRRPSRKGSGSRDIGEEECRESGTKAGRRRPNVSGGCGVAEEPGKRNENGRKKSCIDRRSSGVRQSESSEKKASGELKR